MDTPTQPVAAPILPARAVVAQPVATPPVAASPLPADPSMLTGDEGEAPLDHLRHAGGFFNQPWVQNILPLSSSLLLHIAIIGIGIALAGAYHAIANPNKEQVIVPESKSVGPNETPGGIPHPGLGGDPTRDAAQNITHDTKEDSFNQDPSNNMSNAMPGGNSSSDSDGGLGHHSGMGKGTSSFGGGGGGGGAPWGVPGGGGGMLPKSNFAGTGGNANKIVFLCDASGSMISVSASLKRQLKAAIDEMRCDADAQQEFNVIFFNEKTPQILFKDGLQFANPENKAKASDWIDNVVIAGGTEPMGAVKEALAEKPQLLYVLTDGFDNFSDSEGLLKLFKNGDADGKMAINCIYLQSNDKDAALVELLKSIADIGHGQMKITSKDDM